MGLPLCEYAQAWTRPPVSIALGFQSIALEITQALPLSDTSKKYLPTLLWIGSAYYGFTVTKMHA